MKTFYKLTPKGKKAAKKLNDVLIKLTKVTSEIEEVIDVDIDAIAEIINQSDVLYLYQEFETMEFCDMDNFKGREIDFYRLEQEGLIKETYDDKG